MTQVTLKDVVIAWPSLFEPYASEQYPNTPPKFQASFLVKKGSATDKAIQAIIAAEAEEKFGKANFTKKLQGIKNNPMKICYYENDAMDNPLTEEEGYMVLKASNKVRVPVRDADGRTPLAQQDGRPVAGDRVYAIVDIYAYKDMGGVFATLGGVQFFRKGDMKVGGTSAFIARDELFENLEDGVDESDSIL